MLRRFTIWTIALVVSLLGITGPATATECIEVGQFKHCV